MAKPLVEVLNQARISSEFGPRNAPTPGATTLHNAVDYVTEEGKVFSPVTGVVLREDFDSKAGNFIELLSLGDGSTHLLGHLRDRALKDKGNLVVVGEVVGFMGNTGVSTGSHVHWSIKDAEGNPLENGLWLGRSALTKGEVISVKGELEDGKFTYSIDVTNAVIDSEEQTPASELSGDDLIGDEGINFLI